VSVCQHALKIEESVSFTGHFDTFEKCTITSELRYSMTKLQTSSIVASPQDSASVKTSAGGCSAGGLLKGKLDSKAGFPK
jgi:hypothetical protein